MIYKKECPDCDEYIKYKYKKAYETSIKNNIVCIPCRAKYNRIKSKGIFIRICPKCKNEVVYKNKGSYLYAIKQGRNCLTCHLQSEKMIEITRNRYLGKRRTFTKKWIENLRIGSKKYLQNMTEEAHLDHREKSFYGLWGMSYDDFLKRLPEYKRYRLLVNRETNKQPLYLLENIEKRGRCDINPNAYHLDHKISIHDGFFKNIPYEKIGNFKNLQMLPWRENLSKGRKSDYD